MTLIRATAPTLLLAIAAGARADIAYNNFGPGDSFQGTGWILWGPQAPDEWVQAFRFTAAASGGITRLVVPIVHYSGQNSILFHLHADAAGIPGADLGLIAQSAAPDTVLPPVSTLNAAGTILVQSGTTYWLVGSAAGTCQGGWYDNNQGITGLRAWRNGGEPTWHPDTTTQAAFRIEVAPPCPADFDHNGQVQPADVSLFVNTWFNSLAAGTLAGDFDNNGQVQPADVSLFVSTWFAALTAGC